MTSTTTKRDSLQPAAETAVHFFDDWFDPIESGVRDRVRELIQGMIEGELDMVLSRARYARHAKPPGGEAEGEAGASGHRHGHHVHILEMNGDSFRLAHSKRRSRRAKVELSLEHPPPGADL